MRCLQVSGGGYVVLGNEHNKTASHEEAWVAKLDPGGRLVWKKNLERGGARLLVQTKDGGLLVAGTGWVCRLDQNGRIAWTRLLAVGPSGPASKPIWLQPDGVLVLARGSRVLKLDSRGRIRWTTRRLLTAADFPPGLDPQEGLHSNLSSAAETADGGYVVLGNQRSEGGLAAGWVIRLDRAGHLRWKKAFSDGTVASVAQTADGGYVVAGAAGNFSPDCEQDTWVIRLGPEAPVRAHRTSH